LKDTLPRPRLTVALPQQVAVDAENVTPNMLPTEPQRPFSRRCAHRCALVVIQQQALKVSREGRRIGTGRWLREGEIGDGGPANR
jgi:hypothetical protein